MIRSTGLVRGTEGSSEHALVGGRKLRGAGGERRNKRTLLEVLEAALVALEALAEVELRPNGGRGQPGRQEDAAHGCDCVALGREVPAAAARSYTLTHAKKGSPVNQGQMKIQSR